MLIEIIERRSPVTNRKSVVYLLKCDACAVDMEGCKGRYERSIFHFCDTKCMGRHKRENPDAWPDNGAARNTPESCAKAMATRKRRIEAGEIKHSWTGRRHSEETKHHLSEVASDGRRKGVGNGMYGKRQSESARAKMSDAKSQLIIDGKFRAYGTNNKKGWYESTKVGKSFFYRSSWELALMRHLDSDPDVTAWDYECIRIPYEYDDHKRWYVPDFLVTHSNSSRQLIEVKPREFVGAEKTQLKTEAGRRWCQENDVTFVTVTRQIMTEWGISL